MRQELNDLVTQYRAMREALNAKSNDPPDQEIFDLYLRIIAILTELNQG